MPGDAHCGDAKNANCGYQTLPLYPKTFIFFKPPVNILPLVAGTTKAEPMRALLFQRQIEMKHIVAGPRAAFGAPRVPLRYDSSLCLILRVHEPQRYKLTGPTGSPEGPSVGVR